MATMRRASREAILAAIGLAGGAILLLISGSLGHAAGIGYRVWGWPLIWRYQADLVGTGINWTFFYEDLLFWVVAAVSAVEIGSHLVLPLLRRLAMRYSRRGRISVRLEEEWSRFAKCSSEIGNP